MKEFSFLPFLGYPQVLKVSMAFELVKLVCWLECGNECLMKEFGFLPFLGYPQVMRVSMVWLYDIITTPTC